MSQNKQGIFRKILNILLNIGADPADDEYTRTIKRIYWVPACFGILVELGGTLFFFLSGNPVLGWLYLISFVLFSALLVDGILHPAHFRAIAAVVLFYFVATSVLVTVLLGGIWKTDGTIMIGLMGPLLGLIYFRDRRLAVGLFAAYCALVIALAVAGPGSETRQPGIAGLDPIMLWLGFVVMAAFIFGEIYFFVIQRDKAHRELAEEKAKSEGLLRRIEADLAQAARIQEGLLPKESPKIEGYDISGVNVPCYEVGGDYYDFVPIDEDRVGIAIADVSGKGISASLLMASLRAALLAEVRPDYDLGRMASHLSDFVYKSSGPTSFVTFFFAELDRRQSQVRYVNAGHNPPFILDREGHVRPLEISGFPLGMFAGSTYEARTSPLAAGELAVLFTDGVIEGRNERGEDYSEDRLTAFVRERRTLPAAEICREVLTDVRGYACGSQPCDDITLVVVKRTGA